MESSTRAPEEAHVFDPLTHRFFFEDSPQRFDLERRAATRLWREEHHQPRRWVVRSPIARLPVDPSRSATECR